MLLFVQIQLHDHPSVFDVAEFLIAIAVEFSIRLCHIFRLINFAILFML
jgi:hypothetical protein